MIGVMTFDVRLLSLDATTGRDPIEALVQVFRLDRGRAEQLARRLPYVVKRGVTREQAERVMQALKQIGGRAELLPSSLGEPTEGSLVAPLPLEPPSRFGRQRNTSADAAILPRQSTVGRPAPSTDMRLRTSRQQVFPDAETGRQELPPPRVARPVPQGRTQRSPTGAGHAPVGGAVRPRAPSMHDNLEADISAVLPESTPAHGAGYAKPAQHGGVPNEQTGRVSSYGMNPGHANELAQGRRGYPGGQGPQEAPRAPAYGAKPAAAPARSSSYGMGQPQAEPAQPRGSMYGLPPVSAEATASARPMFANAAPSQEMSRGYSPPAEEASYRTVPYGSPHAVADDLATQSRGQTLFGPASAAAAPESGHFGELATVAAPGAPTSAGFRVANDVQRMPRQTLADVTASMQGLPQLAIHGAHVTAKHQIVPGTANAYGWALVMLFATALIALALGLLVPYGYSAGIVFALWLGVRLTRGSREMAELRSRGIPVGQGQLPEIYACVKQFSVRLGFTDVPLIYLTRNSVDEVRARRRFSRLALELDERFVFEVLRSSRPEILSFHIARGLACHVLGHSSAFRRLLSSISSGLARRDVLSADATATALVIDRTLARAALVALVTRSDLARLLDLEEIERAAVSLRRDGATFRGEDPERCFMGRLDAFLRGYR